MESVNFEDIQDSALSISYGHFFGLAMWIKGYCAESER